MFSSSLTWHQKQQKRIGSYVSLRQRPAVSPDPVRRSEYQQTALAYYNPHQYRNDHFFNFRTELHEHLGDGGDDVQSVAAGIPDDDSSDTHAAVNPPLGSLPSTEIIPTCSAAPSDQQSAAIEALVGRHFRPLTLQITEPPLYRVPLYALLPLAWQQDPFLPNQSFERFEQGGTVISSMLPETSELAQLLAAQQTPAAVATAPQPPSSRTAPDVDDERSKLFDIGDEMPMKTAANGEGSNDSNRLNGNNARPSGNGGNGQQQNGNTHNGSGKSNKNLFKSLKKPPQPHMCIRERTTNGEELFINVMSWTRIMMPNSPDDPIPLYGGMKVSVGVVTPPSFNRQSNARFSYRFTAQVPRCNQRSPPNVYAVMVNPEILRHVGRTCQDPDVSRGVVTDDLRRRVCI